MFFRRKVMISFYVMSSVIEFYLECFCMHVAAQNKHTLRSGLAQMRTRIMNQLQALAMNEGYRWKKKLFSEQGRAQLEKLALAPWASRRQQELLELLDRMNPTIEE